MDRIHGQADPPRRQHRDRRFRSRAGHGVRGAAPLQRQKPHAAVRLEHRRHGLRRSGPRSRSRSDAVHRVVEDLHDARNDDQRPHRARVAACGCRRQRRRGCQTLRGRVHQCRGSDEVRHRHRQHVRVLGLGRRPLLDGIRDRPLDDAGDRTGALQGHARRLPRDGRALPQRTLRDRTSRC